jgi:hypothetical protein
MIFSDSILDDFIAEHDSPGALNEKVTSVRLGRPAL